MGPAGLTAVFGMGTGVAPPVWSPERRRGVVKTTPVAAIAVGSGHGARQMFKSSIKRGCGQVFQSVSRFRFRPRLDSGDRHGVQTRETFVCDRLAGRRAPQEVGDGSGVVKRSAVGTGPLRRSPAVHSQPIDLVVFQEPSHVNVPETSSWRGLRQLDAFSGYPVPTWLPGGALSRTAGTPEERSVLPNPLVLGRRSRKFPTPTADRDRPVSRRSEPSSRTAFIGEQPNPCRDNFSSPRMR